MAPHINFPRLILLLLLAFTSACSAQPVPTQTPAPPPPLPTLTLPPTSTATPTPSPFPSATSTSTPTVSPTLAPAILIGAGDISYCGPDYLGDDQTALLLQSLIKQYPQAALFTAGDNVQGDGLDWEYRDCFNPTWGQFKERIHPSPGNHDIMTGAGAPYYAYFGAAAGQPMQGWYSYDLGSWHIVSLNTNCNDVACGPGSAQANWLEQDLSSHPAACTLLYWHSPRWSSGLAGSNAAAVNFWNIAAQHGAAVVVSGDDHDYERFTPLNAAGTPDPRGVREFVAGTGGAPERVWGPKILPGSEVHNNTTWGVLVFKLYPGRYEWNFAPVAGGAFHDSGAGACP